MSIYLAPFLRYSGTLVEDRWF